VIFEIINILTPILHKVGFRGDVDEGRV